MTSRGRAWFERFAAGAPLVEGLPPSILAADIEIGGRAMRAIAVVPNESARFLRARHGESGIDEGYGLARAVAHAPAGAGILAIVDVPGQAFGLREESIGLQRALAAAVDAYIARRRAGNPVAALIVGKAISGAFLAHGMQAGWIGALRDPQIEVHVMSAAAVARVTRMAPEEIARLADEIGATSRRIESFAALGAVDELFDVADAASPSDADFARVRNAVAAAISRGDLACRNPRDRSPDRTNGALVRRRIGAAWDA